MTDLESVTMLRMPIAFRSALSSVYSAAALVALAALSTLATLANASAQVEQFSYITDRRFTSPEHLLGYNLIPAARQEVDGEIEEVPLGSYGFGIMEHNLYVEGPGIQGVYSVTEISMTEKGFLLRTMNARDPTLQGYLKIAVDDVGYIEGVIFKRSNHEEELMFFLELIPEEVEALESEYFTHVGEEKVSNLDSLWAGVEIHPFFRVHQQLGGIQQRIVPADSLSLRFYFVTTVEQNKRLFRFGPRKKQKRHHTAEELALSASTEAAFAAAPEWTYYVPQLPRYDTFPSMLADTLAPGDSVTPVDSAAAPTSGLDAYGFLIDTVLADGAPFDSLGLALLADTLGLGRDTLLGLLNRELLDSSLHAAADIRIAYVDSVETSLRLIAEAEAEAEAEAARRIKTKITNKFYIDFRALARDRDGRVERQRMTYSVLGAIERENESARPGGERYQWELEIHKHPNAFVYLTEDYAISSIELDGQRFYMRENPVR